jgi:ubiquitin-activating enzyme E1
MARRRCMLPLLVLGVCAVAGHIRGAGAASNHAALRPSHMPLRGKRVELLQRLRGGGLVASPGKRALDSEVEASDLGDGVGGSGVGDDKKRNQVTKRMTVRGGKEEGAPDGEAASKGGADLGEDKMDEALYSRQLYVFGHEAMKKMQQSNILLIGLAGLGVEIAKDLALAGVKSLTLHDPRNVRVDDLSAQFYCGEEHVGQNRAQVSLERLSSLNRHVEMSILDGPVNKTTIGQYSLVICTDSPFGECVMVNDACRAAGVKFIMVQARGLAGNIFVDFGTDFHVTDTNGENPAQAMISMVSNEKPAKLVTLDEQRHGLEDGDFVSFSEVQGMEELNALAEPVKVKVLGPYTLELDLDTTKFGTYVGGGYVRQVKQPAVVQFRSLRDSLKEPQFLTSDFAKMERERQMLLAFQAVDSFFVQLGAYPRPGVAEDGERVLMMARQFNTEIKTQDGRVVNVPLVDEIDEVLIRTVALQARGQIAPMMSVLGSIAAQEVLKGISGKFMPIRQFFVFDSLECLPGPGANGQPLPPEEFEPECSRYDGQIAVLGKTVQRRLEALKYFLVGAGAIGCEMLKNWAMMGVGAGDGGVVHCTDMDVIEKSNLNRQFLFRADDIQKLKSETACLRSKEMNPHMNVKTYSTKMGPDTEDLFDDDWFEALDGVCNALDNVQARTYMDQRCVFLQKSLLESGTLGTKGNVQVVNPKP